MAMHVEPLNGLLVGVEFEPCDGCILLVACLLVVRVIVSIDLERRGPWLDD